MRPANEEEVARQLERGRSGRKKNWEDGELRMAEDLSEEAKFWREFETDEAKAARIKKIPTMPTQKEIEEHMIHHIPSRSWCEFCRYGRGHDDPHAKRKITEELAIPEIFLDYMYLKGKWPFNQLVGDERESCPKTRRSRSEG